ncbi:DUF805 domain-containing protein [Occallatibacter riparius]|uniref:DUF805 domain-containing protein n=1 Tax=Occallatibacter riparius TaxID=1002689 RepID=A0A9J7BNT3_9BACT|nr:DUF805 domain-containing protein [Occallatibacter riparius]UWZ83410.1 DUF805 domain-containing protein [Occallatibacter riparius]
MDWYMLVWRRFAEFNGRSRRSEYWMFALFNCIIFFALCVAAVALGKAGVIFWGVCALYWLAAIIPTIAVGVRRLHDIGMNGLWLLLAFVPLGNLVLLVFFCLDSTPGPNQYGPNPKGIETAIVAS